MKKSLKTIMQDEEALSLYIEQLENEINESENVDNDVSEVLENVLTSVGRFKDRRYLRSTYVDSIANLLKLKSELPLKRLQAKKTLFDIIAKKKELEIKDKSLEINDKIVENQSELISRVFDILDEKNIHPKVIEDETLDNFGLIDTGENKEN